MISVYNILKPNNKTNGFSLWSTDTSIIRRVACPTRVRVRHSYDTRTTLVQTCRRGVKKNNFSFIPTLLKSVSDTYKTLVQTCRGKCSNFILFICFYFSQTYIQRLKMCRNNNIDQWGIKDITFWLHYF